MLGVWCTFFISGCVYQYQFHDWIQKNQPPKVQINEAFDKFLQKMSLTLLIPEPTEKRTNPKMKMKRLL
eukprot:UN11219